MIPAADLIGLFQQMHREHWSYVWGAAQKGCVDCSGAFVYAYRQLDGKSLPHGSNAIARRWITGGMLPVSRAEPGMAAFKARDPGEDGYDLPERYRAGGTSYTGDLLDYYHIGLIDSDPRYVLNAKGTSSGFCRDKLHSGGWDFVAYLTGVEYDQDEREDTKMQAKVVLPVGASGSTVNMRSEPGKTSPVLEKVPVGATVELIEDRTTWCHIEYDGRRGWMMSNYLEYEGQGGESGEAITPEEREKIDAALKQIEQAVEVIGGIIGRG